MDVRWKMLLMVFGLLFVLLIVNGCKGEATPTELSPESAASSEPAAASDPSLDQELRQILRR